MKPSEIVGIAPYVSLHRANTVVEEITRAQERGALPEDLSELAIGSETFRALLRHGYYVRLHPDGEGMLPRSVLVRTRDGKPFHRSLDRAIYTSFPPRFGSWLFWDVDYVNRNQVRAILQTIKLGNEQGAPLRGLQELRLHQEILDRLEEDGFRIEVFSIEGREVSSLVRTSDQWSHDASLAERSRSGMETALEHVLGYSPSGDLHFLDARADVDEIARDIAGLRHVGPRKSVSIAQFLQQRFRAGDPLERLDEIATVPSVGGRAVGDRVVESLRSSGYVVPRDSWSAEDAAHADLIVEDTITRLRLNPAQDDQPIFVARERTGDGLVTTAHFSYGRRANASLVVKEVGSDPLVHRRIVEVSFETIDEGITDRDQLDLLVALIDEADISSGDEVVIRGDSDPRGLRPEDLSGNPSLWNHPPLYNAVRAALRLHGFRADVSWRLEGDSPYDLVFTPIRMETRSSTGP